MQKAAPQKDAAFIKEYNMEHEIARPMSLFAMVIEMFFCISLFCAGSETGYRLIRKALKTADAYLLSFLPVGALIWMLYAVSRLN